MDAAERVCPHCTRLITFDAEVSESLMIHFIPKARPEEKCPQQFEGKDNAPVLLLESYCCCDCCKTVVHIYEPKQNSWHGSINTVY